MSQKQYTYTDEMISFLKENSTGITRKELTDKFNNYFKTDKTVGQIADACKSRGYTNGRKITYTKEMINFLKEHSYGMPRTELTKAFNTKFRLSASVHNIRNVCARRNIFREVMKHEIGEEYTDINDGRIYIKDKNRKWRLKKEYIYEQNYSKIQCDETIIFVDGNSTNFCPTNLLKVKKYEMKAMIGYNFINKDAQTTLLGLSLVRLKIKADELEAKLKSKKREDK